MTARRARAVRVRKGQYACYRAYEQRAHAEWLRENPGDWAPLHARIVEQQYPWLKGWLVLRDTFEGSLTAYFNVVTIDRRAGVPDPLL